MASLDPSSFCSPKNVFTHIKKLLVISQPFPSAQANKSDPPPADELTQPRPLHWEMQKLERELLERCRPGFGVIDTHEPPPTTLCWHGARGENLTRVMFCTRKRRDTMSSSAAPEMYSTSIGP